MMMMMMKFVRTKKNFLRLSPPGGCHLGRSAPYWRHCFCGLCVSRTSH